MNYSSLNIEEILRGYEKRRLENKRQLQKRREQIYALIPRIEEIDGTSTSLYIEAARNRVLHTADRQTTGDTKSTNRALRQEKETLLKKHGYPSDYLDPIYTCRLCHDTGYVEADDSSSQTLVRKCTCFTNQIIDALYLSSNLDKVLEQENFDTFDMSYYSKEKSDQQFSPHENMGNILKRSREFTKSFEVKERDRGNILMYGETGMGKTFLTNCIAKELLDKGHSVLYLSANELFETILSSYVMNQKTEFAELYNYIYNSELLIIDDLGTELTNNFVLSQLFEIINQRSIKGVSTLISSNLTMTGLRERYSERIVSRIIADYTVFYMYGDNIRYQKRKKTITSNT
ncbi:MAG: ATP-binding protein [Clostridium sp.]|nr:ATP-binding protein [Clostridium sp.]MCM1398661.1 ATP-binding protein [Clostridium sp.]MCM1459946.1 ATP-binding protein [Bacteroides sp.]